jgi:putative acetyltransferase
MTQDDDDAVCRISAACYRFAVQVHDFTDQEAKTALHEHCRPDHIASLRVSGNALVAEWEGQIAGVIVTRGNSIQVLFVDPTLHRKGVGRALFRRAEEMIAQAGHSTLTLKTRPSAIPFYLAMRMECTGHWHPKNGAFAGMQLTVLDKQLNPQPFAGGKAAAPRASA